MPRAPTPPTAAAARWRRCSVVSTSGLLLLHPDGARIDAADAVIRLGWAPVGGYERSVGARTSLRVAAPSAFSSRRNVSSADVSRVLAHAPAGSAVAFLALEGGWCERSQRALAQCFPRLAFSRVPRRLLLERVARCLATPPAASAVLPPLPPSRRLSPTSGFAAIFYLLASAMCDELTLWGFGDGADGAAADAVGYHYFGGGGGDVPLRRKFRAYHELRNGSAHDFVREHQWLRAAAAAGGHARRGRSISLSRAALLAACNQTDLAAGGIAPLEPIDRQPTPPPQALSARGVAFPSVCAYPMCDYDGRPRRPVRAAAGGRACSSCQSIRAKGDSNRRAHEH
ncbi:hypothetical protein AB1Y20_018207 [Prymnesium parvum]|uniref:Uncharacterized protein n=1 Tax=Prymnesium parvum TaxID=97485 RepID=A0AB34JQ12_PRYPA